jgi:hypothetical protein
MQTHKHNLRITGFVFSDLFLVNSPWLLDQKALQPNLTKKLAAKFNVIRNRRMILGILGNTFTKTGLKALANFPEAPEMIKVPSTTQKKQISHQWNTKSQYFYSWQ